MKQNSVTEPKRKHGPKMGSVKKGFPPSPSPAKL